VSENGEQRRQDQQEGPFWERQPDEPATAYQAFTVYRDQGITRSLRKAAAAFYAQREPDADGDQRESAGSPESGTSGQVARFKAWSREHLWQARVEAFDAEEARKRSLKRQQERIEMHEQHLKLVRLGLNVSAQTLWACMRGESYFPPSQIPSLVNSITSLHRLTLGEATAIEATRGSGDPEQQVGDWSRLSEEELDVLLRLFDKAMG